VRDFIVVHAISIDFRKSRGLKLSNANVVPGGGSFEEDVSP
jgi:hypothetical protein